MDLKSKVEKIVNELKSGQNDFNNVMEATKMLVSITTLFETIEHGEVGHREWLKEAIEAHFTGKPMPEYKAK